MRNHGGLFVGYDRFGGLGSNYIAVFGRGWTATTYPKLEGLGLFVSQQAETCLSQNKTLSFARPSKNGKNIAA
jgi:hypothetical protein